MRARLLVLPAVLLALALGSRASQDAAPGPDAGVDLDALIDALPPVGRELAWDGGREAPVAAAAEMRRRIEAGLALDDDRWRRALTRTGAIRMRERWPTTHPFAVGLQVPWWLGAAEIRLVPRAAGWKAARARKLPEDAGVFEDLEAFLYQELGPLPAAPDGGTLALAFDVVVARPDAAGRELWRGELTHVVRPVASVADAVPPESGAEVDALVRAAAGLAFRTGPYDEQPDRSPVLVIDPPPASGPPLALVLRVEVLHAGEAVEERRLVALARDPDAARAPRPDPLAAAAPLASLLEEAAADPDALEGWSVRLTGVEPGVLAVFGALARYEGAVTVPLAEARARELERAGPHGREPWPWRPRPR